MAQGSIDKAELLELVRQHMEAELENATRSQESTQKGATHEESKAENDKDTRALEATYLARGLAQRVVELESGLSALSVVKLRDFDDDSPIALTALILLEDEDEEHSRTYFLLPAGAGLRVELGGTTITVVTPKSPVGRTLLGQRSGDDIDIKVPAGRKQWTIAEVS